ncbi:hypothetical protein COCSUDRAFT_42308 [Coccomyxa subellipsoidea C-169]|uniref:Uncharacterized protein n=1 Tax=Coccomyxa subellipsoidea (strain C-169) TaxID=574566 RepID=I0YW82_COCSC|nr:hypothetical protein COCSUDRAFT_42308 [Coccomyxa subellipsoidea C-169]EIE22651.1 hypothetical protein COCSUDRAFT_42308 [Coccomyxa subellipsoidea C-169]|eukprot:XP_005647195.1 hypothetical protein COCSUDRAFT_42308 [Coccomyxa subellipsoidea C-169]
MARHCDFVFVVAVTCLLRLAFGQEQILLQNAKQNNLVDIQFFADSNFQQTRTPFAYFDFPAIQQGSCTQCEDFQDAPLTWGSAVIAYSPTGGEVMNLYQAAECNGEPMTTGASAPAMPSNFQAKSFKLCRTG